MFIFIYAGYNFNRCDTVVETSRSGTLESCLYHTRVTYLPYFRANSFSQLTSHACAMTWQAQSCLFVNAQYNLSILEHKLQQSWERNGDTFFRIQSSSCMTMVTHILRKLWLNSLIAGDLKYIYHSPYFPDLSTCDFDFTPNSKHLLRGIRFHNIHRFCRLYIVPLEVSTEWALPLASFSFQNTGNGC